MVPASNAPMPTVEVRQVQIWMEMEDEVLGRNARPSSPALKPYMPGNRVSKHSVC